MNIWLIADTYNIEFLFSQVAGQANNIADLLLRWSVTVNPIEKLNDYLKLYMG